MVFPVRRKRTVSTWLRPARPHTHTNEPGSREVQRAGRPQAGMPRAGMPRARHRATGWARDGGQILARRQAHRPDG
jgi:hypothetical protein